MQDLDRQYQQVGPSTIWNIPSVNLLCRLCANSNDYLIPIFKDEGMHHQLSSKINRHLTLKISEEDLLPAQVCYPCASTLLAFHDMFENCIEAEKRLKNLLANEKLKETVKCIETSENFFPELGVTLERQFETTSLEKIVEDEFRSKQPVKKRLLVETEKLDNFGGLEKSSSKEVLSGNNRYTAFRTFIAHMPLYNYLDQFKNKTSTEVCESIVIQETNLQLQNSKSVREDFEIKSENSENNPSSESENLKIKENDSSKLYVCDSCSKKFKYKVCYSRHMRIHSNERPFCCLECGKTFRDSGGLSRHTREVHMRLREHPCDLCSKSFANKATLNDHRRIHTGDKPYICDSCGKLFKSKAGLYNHSKVHMSAYPHVCSYCTRRFKRRHHLNEHISVHTGEKIHICDKCGKGFRVRSELLRHIHTHSEEKPFTCVECGTQFRQRRYLKNHLKSHQKLKTF